MMNLIKWILLGKRGKGPSRPYSVRTFAIGAWAPPRLAFGLKSEANWDLQTKGVCDVFLWPMPVERRGCSVASSRPGHQVGRAAVGVEVETPRTKICFCKQGSKGARPEAQVHRA